MAINIKQLYDDLAKFYPISCVEAVVGGTVTEANEPTKVNLSDCITNNFKTDNFEGSFMMYFYDDNLVRINLEVSKNPSYDIKAGKNIIASDLPVIYHPEKPIFLKALTDDEQCKVSVLLDTDGKVYMCVIPNEKISVSGNIINRYAIINISQISAMTFFIKEN